MIGGIEAIHAWTPPGASKPVIELNRIKDDKGSLVWPRYKVRAIPSGRGLGEPEDNRDRPVGSTRELARLSLRRGKTWVYEGLIKARTLLELREAEDALREAFDDETAEGRMDVFWHPLLKAFAAQTPKFYEARALTCEIVDVQGSQRWDRPFVLGLRASDRRHFEEDGVVHTVEVKNTNTGYDFT